jgi:hypothetical protein
VLEASKLEAIFVFTRGKRAKYLKPSQARPIAFSCFYAVFVNLHCETEDATSTNPSMRTANWHTVAS